MGSKVQSINTKFKEFISYCQEKEITEINICMHDHPDPDAIGSAMGMSYLLKSYNIDSKLYYSGDISHPQNKTIINVLNINMNKVPPNEPEGATICVDSTENNSCATDPVFVVDHHKSTSKAKLKIIDSSYGACSTIVWQLIKTNIEEIDTEYIDTFTALLLGVRTDTNDLISSNISKYDFEAYQELLDKSDSEKLQKVMNYPFPAYLYDKRIELYKDGNYQESNGIFVGGIGYIPEEQRDVIAILSEEYVRKENVQTTVIFAIVGKKTLHVSVRSSNVSWDVNQEMKSMFGEYGGGASYKGAAKVPLLFYEGIESIDFWKLTCEHMFKRVLKESFNEKPIIKKK